MLICCSPNRCTEDAGRKITLLARSTSLLHHCVPESRARLGHPANHFTRRPSLTHIGYISYSGSRAAPCCTFVSVPASEASTRDTLLQNGIVNVDKNLCALVASPRYLNGAIR